MKVKVDGLEIHMGVPEHPTKGDVFYVPADEMNRELMCKCKRLEGWVGVYEWCV